MAQINYTTLNQLDEGTQINDSDFIYLKGAGEDGADFKAKAKTLKDFSRPENASADSGGLLTKLEQEIAGLKKFISGLEAQFASIKNDLSVQGSATIQGSLDISGDLRVKGKTKKIESSTLEIANNEIITRAESQSSLGVGEYTGIRAKNYDGKNDGRLVFGKDGVARVGDEGQEQALATREDSPRDKSLAIWDAKENRYKSIGLGNLGDLLESKGEGNPPRFTSFPKINVKSITQTVTSLEDGGENEITCELTNGVKTTFTVRNGSKGNTGGIDAANIDTEVIKGSSKLITSGGVAKALDKIPDSVKSVKYAESAGSAPASDVFSWAKQPNKPSYSKAELGLGNVDNTADSQKSVNYANSAGSAGSASNADTVDGFHAGNANGMLVPVIDSKFDADRGYIKLANGLLVQWGKAVDPTPVTFALEYSSVPIILISRYSNDRIVRGNSVTSPTTRGFTPLVGYEGDTLSWLAVGY